MFLETCREIRSNLAEIAKLKKVDTSEAKREIKIKQKETCLLLTVLKKLNRIDKFRTKAERDALHQEKLRMDSTKLQVQNLIYECTYLKKEISKCFQFKSMDEEIDLISVEQFYKEAPETIAKPVCICSKIYNICLRLFINLMFLGLSTKKSSPTTIKSFTMGITTKKRTCSSMS